jgi:hypothetical protein
MSNNRHIFSPYIPNLRDRKKDKGRPIIHEYLHRIAYTETMRGNEDEIPTLLFYGAPFALLKDACCHIHKTMCGNVRDLKIKLEHSCRHKNGKCYWRYAVSVINLNEHFISFKEFTLLLIAHIRNICNCAIRHYRLETFLNL